jgi:hypothetical protein
MRLSVPICAIFLCLLLNVTIGLSVDGGVILVSFPVMCKISKSEPLIYKTSSLYVYIVSHCPHDSDVLVVFINLAQTLSPGVSQHVHAVRTPTLRQSSSCNVRVAKDASLR